MDDIFYQLQGAFVFSKIELRSSYQQLNIEVIMNWFNQVLWLKLAVLGGSLAIFFIVVWYDSNGCLNEVN